MILFYSRCIYSIYPSKPHLQYVFAQGIAFDMISNKTVCVYFQSRHYYEITQNKNITQNMFHSFSYINYVWCYFLKYIIYDMFSLITDFFMKWSELCVISHFVLINNYFIFNDLPDLYSIYKYVAKWYIVSNT